MADIAKSYMFSESAEKRAQNGCCAQTVQEFVFIFTTPRIINVVVFRVPLQELWYNCLDAVDWYITPTTRWFSEGSNHSLFAVC